MIQGPAKWYIKFKIMVNANSGSNVIIGFDKSRNKIDILFINKAALNSFTYQT